MQKIQQSSSHRLWQERLVPLCLVLIAIVAGSISLRLGKDSLQQDPDAYAQLAITLAETGTFGIKDPSDRVHPTAYRPALYPWLLSWFVADGQLNELAVAWLHVVLLCILSVTVWDIGRKLQIGWPWLPAMLICIDPLILRSTQQVMTELLATTLATIVWWLWLVLWPQESQLCSTSGSTQRSKSQWVALYLLGLAFGLSVLARPTAALWVALFSLCMTRLGCTCWKRRLVDLITVSVGVAICVLPWTLRNWAQLGQPIWGTTHGGYTLLLANNPSLYHHFQLHGGDRDWEAETFHHNWALRGLVDKQQLLSDSFWLSESLAEEGSGESSRSPTVYSLGELPDDALAYEIARHTIDQDPFLFAKSCIYRLGWFWSCWPNGVGKAQTAIIGVWYAAFFVLAIIGIRRSFSNFRRFLISWLPALLLIVVLSLVHSVYWSNMRMRCPLMPSIYLLAIVALRAPKIEPK